LGYRKTNDLKTILQILFILFLGTATFAQQAKDTVPTIHFQIVNAVNGNPISLGHVINTGIGKGTVSDMLGYFDMPITVGDTLIISALGFHQMKIPSWGQFTTDSLYYPIRLTPKSYEIREVRITRFGSYQRFIKEVASMEMPKSEQEELQEKLNEYIKKTIDRMELISAPPAAGGFTFGTDWYVRQMEKIEEKKEEDLKWDIILRKFSADIVKDLTGLDDLEAIKFMMFCDFTEGYLLIASEYEVKQRILDKFEAYKQHKKLNHEGPKKR